MVIIFSAALVVLLFGLAFDAGLMHSVGNPANVKKVLSNSGVYDSVVSSALNQARSISTATGNIPLNDPRVQAAAESAIPPAQVKIYANQVIDSVYGWLKGQTATPNFQIDLSGAKANFADNLAETVQERANSLPVCTDTTAPNFDAYSAKCLPPGVTPAQAASSVRDQILNGQGFLDKTVISARDVKKSGTNQSIFSTQLKQLPMNYQRFRSAPIIISILAVLAAIGVVFLSSSRRRGTKRVGLALAGVGIFILLFAWGLNRATTHVLVPKISLDNATAQKKTRTVVTDLVQVIDKNYWIFGAAYTILGGAVLASEWLILSRLNRNSTPKPPKQVDQKLV